MNFVREENSFLWTRNGRGEVKTLHATAAGNWSYVAHACL